LPQIFRQVCQILPKSRMEGIPSGKLGYQLKAEECDTKRRTLPLNFLAFSGKPKTF
jgi:hypothetical protein